MNSPCSPPPEIHVEPQSNHESNGNKNRIPESFQSPRPVSKLRTPGSCSKKMAQSHMFSSPSPGHKLPGSGTRNELFLKSVLSSPYHHNQLSYTPLSATPAESPHTVFKTPIRSGRMSPVHMSTPQDTKPPSGHPSTSSRKKKRIVNPFDAALLDQLEGPVFMSPGVFSVQSTPSTDEKKPFRWSIEHIAVLNPADIDEMPVQQHIQITPDKEVEERAQRAIDNFFSNNLIAPSPWNPDCKETNKNSGTTPPNMCLESELQGSIQKQLPAKRIVPETQEASCQTVLSLPLDFDTNKILGQYMLNDVEEENNPEVLSASSLRRKLFFQADSSSFMISPVKTGFIDDSILHEECASPKVISASQATVPFQQATPLKPPTRNHFSSSPIKNVKGLRTPKFQPTPSRLEFLDSPQLSPIVHGHMPKRASGIFSPHSGSFMEGDGLQKNISKEFDKSLRSPELSPIKPHDVFKTPNPRNRSKLSLESPGVSPICAARPGGDNDDTGSFLGQKDNDLVSSDESDDGTTTPLARNNVADEQKQFTATRKISHLTRHRQRNIYLDFEETAMDFETESHPSKHLRFADDIKTSSLLVTRDFSMVDMDLDENNAAPNITNQDTGYQTASLQSTNHDTGSHTNLTSSQEAMYSVSSGVTHDVAPHTNLTSLFSKLPIDSIIQDDFEDGIQNPCAKILEDSALDIHDNQEYKLEKPLIDQILDVTNPEKYGHGPYNEEEILERARQVLEMANRLYPEIDTCTGEEQEMTSKLKSRLSILHELEPIVASTPHKKAYSQENTQATSSAAHTASEQAMAILRRAGEDLAKFGDLLSSIKSSVEESGIHNYAS